MNKQVKSRQRVADHGEVFTAEREVKAMCDLVLPETQRIDSRFLEPACGDGNFLAEVLSRKLAVVRKKYKRSTIDYEMNSLLAVSSLYGVDILADNVAACRERLYKLWAKQYKSVCKNECSDDMHRSIRFMTASAFELKRQLCFVELFVAHIIVKECYLIRVCCLATVVSIVIVYANDVLLRKSFERSLNVAHRHCSISCNTCTAYGRGFLFAVVVAE